MTNRNRSVRVDRNTLDKLKEYSRGLASIENNDVPIGEVIRRLSSGEDMLIRLRAGAIERKMGMKK